MGSVLLLVKWVTWGNCSVFVSPRGPCSYRDGAMTQITCFCFPPGPAASWNPLPYKLGEWLEMRARISYSCNLMFLGIGMGCPITI